MALLFLQAAADGTDLTTYTFSTQNLGTAAADRHIIVSIMARKSGAATTISSVTIGGVAATISVQRSEGANASTVGIAIANVPTGTTGDIVVVFAAGQVRCAIGAYRADNLASATAHDTDSSIVAEPSVALDVPIGFAIGAGVTGTSGTGASWVGLTENFDAALETQRYTGASDEFVAAETGRTITITFNISATPVGCFASWAFVSTTFIPKVIIM